MILNEETIIAAEYILLSLFTTFTCFDCIFLCSHLIETCKNERYLMHKKS